MKKLTEWNRYGSRYIYSLKDVAFNYDKRRFTTLAGKLFDQREKDKLLSVANSLKKDSKILDVGAGTGRFSIALALKGYKNITTTDISPNMLKIINEKVKNNKLKTVIHIKKADIYNLPFKNNVFKLTYSIRVLNQLYNNKDKFRAIDELIRVTAKGGIIFFDIINNNSLGKIIQPKGLISVKDIEKYLKTKHKDVKLVLIQGNLILSQTLLEKSLFATRFVNYVDTVLSDRFPQFATRVYIKLLKK